MKLTVAMIVKNEEKHLKDCLDSVAGADEIIICDTGSSDRTVEVAKEYTDKVFTDYKWNDSFADVRNHALAKVDDNTWVLSIDADETLQGTIDDVRRAITESESAGFRTIRVRLKCARTGQVHQFPRIFKKCPEVYWKGAIHNYLSMVEDNSKEITIVYGYSEAHKQDPDRAFRILSRECERNPSAVREKYYLAREYYYKRDYKKALEWYDKYLAVSFWLPEKADALLMASKCLWMLRQGAKARAYAFDAVKLNPDFKEALLMLAETHHSPWKEKWLHIAENATNKDVLFIRTK